MVLKAHLGRERFKYVYQVRDIAACELAGLARDGFVGVRIQWTRGSSKTTTQFGPLTDDERVGFVETPMLVCSMFRLRKSGVAFDPKPSTFTLIGVKADGSLHTVGSCICDLSQLASIEEAALNPSMHLDLPLTMRSRTTRARASIRLTMTARLIRPFNDPADSYGADDDADECARSRSTIFTSDFSLAGLTAGASGEQGEEADGEGSIDWDSDESDPAQSKKPAPPLAAAPAHGASSTARAGAGAASRASADGVQSAAVGVPARPSTQPRASSEPRRDPPTPTVQPAPESARAVAAASAAAPTAGAVAGATADTAVHGAGKQLRVELSRAHSRAEALASACARLEEEVLLARSAQQEARAASAAGRAAGAGGEIASRGALVALIVRLRADLLATRAQLHAAGAAPPDGAAPALPLERSIDELACAAAAAMLPPSRHAATPSVDGVAPAPLNEALVSQLALALDEMNELESKVNQAKAGHRAALKRATAADSRATLLEAQLAASLTVQAAQAASGTSAPRQAAQAHGGARCASGGYADAFLPQIERLETELAAITAERDRLREQLQERAGVVRPPDSPRSIVPTLIARRSTVPGGALGFAL